MNPERSGQRRQRRAILEAAARLIASHGYHGMSMRHLAAVTGKGLSSLYNYFPSKEGILFAIQREAFSALIASTTGALASVRDPEARLYLFVSHHVRYFTEHPEVMRVLVHEAATLPPQRRRELRALKERYFEIGRAIVADLVARRQGRSGEPPAVAGRDADAELDRLAYALFGMLNWIYAWYRPGVHGSPREVARTIHRLALSGLGDGRRSAGIQDRMDRHLAAMERPPLLGGFEGGPTP